MPRKTRPLDDDNMRAVVGSENALGNMRDKKHDITTAASFAEDETNTDSEQIITVTTTTSRKVCLHTQISLPFFHLSVDTTNIFSHYI